MKDAIGLDIKKIRSMFSGLQSEKTIAALRKTLRRLNKKRSAASPHYKKDNSKLKPMAEPKLDKIKVCTTKIIRKKLAYDTRQSLGLLQEFTDSLVLLMQNMLLRGVPVEIRGIGKFSVISRKVYGRNMKTGEKITKPKQKRIKFRPSAHFVRRLNQ